MVSAARPKSRFVGTIQDQTGDMAQYKIGEILKKEGLITARQLAEALEVVKKNGGFIGSYLLKKGDISESTIPSVLSRRYNYPIIKLSERQIPDQALKLIPYELAKKHFAFPVQVTSKNLIVAFTEPTNAAAIEELTLHVKTTIRAGVAPEKEIIEAYRRYYKISDEDYRALINPDAGEEDEEPEIDLAALEDFGELAGAVAEDFITTETGEKSETAQYHASDAPIIKLVNGILIKAVEEGISDIHIEPFENFFYVRYRMDGALYKSMNLPYEIRNAIIARFKIIAGLDITEKRVPQDGRFKLRLGSKKTVDFRVSSLPTMFGESIVLRVLDKTGLRVDLCDLGFSKPDYEKFHQAITRPYGLVLVTGPTGSGKTTTLYSALSMLNKEDVKILTAEDPIEFNFKGMNQVNVNRDVGMTFARALKAFLRQDPDICMIGEIRDTETAGISVEAAMTGHMVFSTLHTNDCAGTLSRLLRMGIPSYDIASSVTLVTAQRLLRRICPRCKTPVESPDVQKLLEAGFQKSELEDIQLYEGKGCEHCSGTGYKGRLAVFEVLEMTETLAQAICLEVPESQLRKIGLQEGMRTLRQDALMKVKQGLTTLDETLKKTVLFKETIDNSGLTADEMLFEAGEIIVREGEREENFYKLVQGSLEVLKGQERISEISEPESYFGAMSAMMGGNSTATIRALTKSIIKVYPGYKLWETLEGVTLNAKARPRIDELDLSKPGRPVVENHGNIVSIKKYVEKETGRLN